MNTQHNILREPLPAGIWIRVPAGETYMITDAPFAEGGGSLVYPAVKLNFQDGHYVRGEISYAIKECFPICTDPAMPRYIRDANLEIIPENDPADSTRYGMAMEYLENVHEMQRKEEEVSTAIYKKGFRILPTLGAFSEVEISKDEGIHFHRIRGVYTIMESLEQKGAALRTYLSKKHGLAPAIAFHVIGQILLAIKEVHDAGYLHLDIGDGNIFIKGSLKETGQNSQISLIDFGSARKMESDGLCATVDCNKLFSTLGFTAPEMRNQKEVRLGKEADIYSVGCLLIYLLTGRKYTAVELDHKNINDILTRARLRKIACPKHMIPKMKEIICRAISYEVTDRYHSCEEMLDHVVDFTQALSPYRSDLNQVVYDAFICYKHGPVDSVVARDVQNLLEHFPVKSSGGKKIERVFLDEGELSSCADMGQQIKDAINNSGWFILICSEETKESHWVQEEINQFLESHDPSRILLIMTSGEAQDIFPKPFDADQQLAADARGKDLQEIRKKLRKDAILRVAAPILGLTYDSLRQRRKNYIIKRAMAAAMMAFCLLSAFTIHTLYQSAQISKQYQQARRNEARYLSDLSIKKYKNGDREGALLTALALDPEKEDVGKAIVPEQMYALNNALSSYKIDEIIDFSPTTQHETKDMLAYEPSKDGEYVAILDHTGFSTYDWATGENDWQIPFSLEDNNCGLYAIRQSGMLLSMTENGIQKIKILDLAEKEIRGEFPVSGNMIYATIDENGQYLAIPDMKEKCLRIYDIDRQKETGTMDDLDENAHIITFSPNAGKIAIGMNSIKGDQAGLTIYDVKTGQKKIISHRQVAACQFIDEEKIIALEYTQQESENNGNDIWGTSQKESQTILYDTSTGSKLYEGQKEKSDMLIYGMDVDTYSDRDIPLAMVWNRNLLEIINTQNGKRFKEIRYHSDIAGVKKYDNARILLSFQSGNTQLISLADFSSYNVIDMDISIDTFLYSGKCKSTAYISPEKITFCHTNSDPEMKKITLDDNDAGDIYDVRYISTENDSYRIILLGDMNGQNAMRIYSMKSGDKVFSYKGKALDNISIKLDESGDYLIFTDKVIDQDDKFLNTKEVMIKKYRLSDGQEVCQAKAEISNKIYVKDASQIYYFKEYELCQLDLSSPGATKTIDTSDAYSRYTMKAAISKDGKYLIYQANNAEKGIYMYDTEEGKITPLAIEKDQINLNGIEEMILAETKPLLCLIDQNHSICIMDLTQKQVIHHYEQDTRSNMKAAFMKEDKFLLVESIDSISVYDLSMVDQKPISIFEKSSFAQDQYSFIGNMIYGDETDYFGIKYKGISEDVTSDKGIDSNDLYVYYIDEEGKIYPYAKVENGHMSCLKDHVEIGSSISQTYAYNQLYDFEILRSKGLMILDGKKLTEEERRRYFIE